MKKGFTLAEVLITLGIIGIVAAITMPVLMANSRKKVAETRLAKFYSVVNQAIRLSEAENGDKKDWDALGGGYLEDEDGNIDMSKPLAIDWYNKYFAKYITGATVKMPNNNEGKLEVYFSDGSMVLISESSWIFFPNAKDYKRITIENSDGSNYIGRDKKLSGTKWFTFYFYQNGGGVDPYGGIKSNLSDNVLRTDGVLGCSKTLPSNERAYCTLVIAKNGWKIPDDYPLRF